jgi:hypothetical protein
LISCSVEGTRQDFSSLKQLNMAATTRDVCLHLEPVETIYDRYRMTRADWTYVLIVVILIPLAALFFLFRRLTRLRHDPERNHLLPELDSLAARIPWLRSGSLLSTRRNGPFLRSFACQRASGATMLVRPFRVF